MAINSWFTLCVGVFISWALSCNEVRLTIMMMMFFMALFFCTLQSSVIQKAYDLGFQMREYEFQRKDTIVGIKCSITKALIHECSQCNDLI